MKYKQFLMKKTGFEIGLFDTVSDQEFCFGDLPILLIWLSSRRHHWVMVG